MAVSVGFSGEQGRSLDSQSRRGVNAENEMYKGLGWASHDSQNSTRLAPRRACLHSQCYSSPHTLKKLKDGHLELRSSLREHRHYPSFLTPRKLERNTGACGRKSSSDGPKVQEPASLPSLAECRLFCIQSLSVRSLECPFRFLVFRVEAVQAKHLPWWLLQAVRVFQGLFAPLHDTANQEERLVTH